MRRAFGFLLLGLFVLEVSAQKQGNVWVFPDGNTIDFNTDPPEHSNSGMIFSPVSSVSEGVSSIADSSGSLLFYSDGTAIWSSDHVIIPNGDDLLGHPSATQSAFILPFPQRNDKYYVFTTDAWENGLSNGLRYSVVSLCEDEESLAVTEKNVLLRDNVTEKLCATRHANGMDYWLIAHALGSSKFLIYRVSPSGIELSDSTSVGQSHPQNPQGAVGQMKFSPQGNRIALTISNTPTPGLELFSFNNSSGTVSSPVFFNPDSLEGSPMPFYGLSFSPDGSKLYAAPFYWERLYQIDLTQGNSVQQLIANSLLLNSVWNSPLSISQLQVAPNGKIYGTVSGTTSLLVINEPNLSGVICDFVQSGFSLGTNTSNWGLPGFVDNFDYSSAGNCDTLTSIAETTDAQLTLQVYPNPASTQTQLNYRSPQGTRPMLQLRDMLGRTVQTVQLPSNKGSYTLNATGLGTGVYFCSLLNGTEVLATQKLSVLKN